MECNFFKLILASERKKCLIYVEIYFVVQSPKYLTLRNQRFMTNNYLKIIVCEKKH